MFLPLKKNQCSTVPSIGREYITRVECSLGSHHLSLECKIKPLVETKACIFLAKKCHQELEI